MVLIGWLPVAFGFGCLIYVLAMRSRPCVFLICRLSWNNVFLISISIHAALIWTDTQVVEGSGLENRQYGNSVAWVRISLSPPYGSYIHSDARCRVKCNDCELGCLQTHGYLLINNFALASSVNPRQICYCGGIGRHKGLKIPRSEVRIGSSPISSTI